MAKGDGSVTEVKTKEGNSYRPKKWRVCVSFGFDPVTKKRDQVVKIVTGTKADANKKRDEIKRNREAGILSDGYKMTFSDFSERWLTSRKESDQLAEATINEDKTIVSLFNSFIGHVKLQDITPTMIENVLSETKRKRGGLSGTTMSKYYKKMKQILADAEFKGLILRNPCSRVKAPKKNKPDRKPLDAEQFSIFSALVDQELQAAISDFEAKEERRESRNKSEGRTRIDGLANISSLQAVKADIETGARLGEILATTWGHVSFRGLYMDIQQSITAKGTIKPPKSESGFRKIFVTREYMRELKSWQKLQRKLLLALGIEQTENTPVFCSNVGGFINPPNFEHWFKKLKERIGFPDLRFHELRHTQATQLIENGANIKTVQARLGHSSASTTLDFYAHASTEKDKEAAEIISAIARRKPKETPIIAIKTA